MPGVRAATLDGIGLLTSVAASGFHDDPVMSWVFADSDSDQRS